MHRRLFVVDTAPTPLSDKMPYMQAVQQQTLRVTFSASRVVSTLPRVYKEPSGDDNIGSFYKQDQPWSSPQLTRPISRDNDGRSCVYSRATRDWTVCAVVLYGCVVCSAWLEAIESEMPRLSTDDLI